MKVGEHMDAYELIDGLNVSATTKLCPTFVCKSAMANVGHSFEMIDGDFVHMYVAAVDETVATITVLFNGAFAAFSYIIFQGRNAITVDAHDVFADEGGLFFSSFNFSELEHFDDVMSAYRAIVRDDVKFYAENADRFAPLTGYTPPVIFAEDGVEVYARRRIGINLNGFLSCNGLLVVDGGKKVSSATRLRLCGQARVKVTNVNLEKILKLQPEYADEDFKVFKPVFLGKSEVSFMLIDDVWTPLLTVVDPDAEFFRVKSLKELAKRRETVNMLSGNA